MLSDIRGRVKRIKINHIIKLNVLYASVSNCACFYNIVLLLNMEWKSNFVGKKKVRHLSLFIDGETWFQTHSQYAFSLRVSSFIQYIIRLSITDRPCLQVHPIDPSVSPLRVFAFKSTIGVQWTEFEVVEINSLPSL